MDLLPYFLCRYVPDSTSRVAHSFLCICRPIVSNTCSTGLENSVPERTQRQNQPAQHCRSTSQSRLRTQAMHYSGDKGLHHSAHLWKPASVRHPRSRRATLAAHPMQLVPSLHCRVWSRRSCHLQTRRKCVCFPELRRVLHKSVEAC